MTLNQIEKICEEQGFWVNKYDDMFGKGEPGWEFGQMTPCGEDWIEVIETNDVDTLIEKLRQRVDNWDSEEEAKIWFESAGKNGVPGIRDLLDDADWKLEQLKDLLNAIKEAPDEEDEVNESEKITETVIGNVNIDNYAINELIESATDLNKGESTIEYYDYSNIGFSIYKRTEDDKSYNVKAWYDDSNGNEIDLNDDVVDEKDLKTFFINTIEKAVNNGYQLADSEDKGQKNQISDTIFDYYEELKRELENKNFTVDAKIDNDEIDLVVSKENVGIGVSLYSINSDFVKSHDYNEDIIGLGGDTTAKETVYPKYRDGWEYESATPVDINVDINDEVYAMFNVISVVTIADVIDIIENSFKDNKDENKEMKIESIDYKDVAKKVYDISTEEIVTDLAKHKDCDERLKEIAKKYKELNALNNEADENDNYMYDKYVTLDNEAEKIIAELAGIDYTELGENKKIKTEASENSNIENDAVEDIIQEFKDRSPLYERVIGEIVEDSEDYEGTTLLERINGRLQDLSHGLASGVVGSLIYYSDTVKFFNDYYDDIWDVVETISENGLEPFEALKQHCNETEIIMGSDSVKNYVVWMVYEEIAFQFENALSEL